MEQQVSLETYDCLRSATPYHVLNHSKIIISIHQLNQLMTHHLWPIHMIFRVGTLAYGQNCRWYPHRPPLKTRWIGHKSKNVLGVGYKVADHAHSIIRRSDFLRLMIAADHRHHPGTPPTADHVRAICDLIPHAWVMPNTIYTINSPGVRLFIHLLGVDAVDCADGEQ